jgi:hypothetical protein
MAPTGGGGSRAGWRSIAWLVAGGNRRLRFRKTALNDLWLHHRVAGLNLRRLLAPRTHPQRRNLGNRLTRAAGQGVSRSTTQPLGATPRRDRANSLSHPSGC